MQPVIIVWTVIGLIGTAAMLIGYCSYVYRVVHEEYIHVTAQDVRNIVDEDRIPDKVNILV